MPQLRLAGERAGRQAGRQWMRRLQRLPERVYGELSGEGRAAGLAGQPGGLGGHPPVRLDGRRGIEPMELDAWLQQSTAASGVPLQVTSAEVLMDIAALLPHSSIESH